MIQGVRAEEKARSAVVTTPNHFEIFFLQIATLKVEK
jgi:hypothetical protein